MNTFPNLLIFLWGKIKKYKGKIELYQKGQFTGCLAPFGYRKDPKDKKHLLVDGETAPVVRLIFGYALDGHGSNYIRRRLEEDKHLCPAWWNRQRGHRNIRTTHEKFPKRVFSCKTYNAYGKQHCTQHRIEFDTLYSLVLNKIRECAAARQKAVLFLLIGDNTAYVGRRRCADRHYPLSPLLSGLLL